MAFELETILLLVLVFGASVLIGVLLRVRTRRNLPDPVHREADRSMTPTAEPEAVAAPGSAGTPRLQPHPGANVSHLPLSRTQVGEATHPGRRPPTLTGPIDGRADDLKVLRGIGPQNEARLNALGIFHLQQIAAWTAEEAQWVGSSLAFSGRIERENWIGQARMLVSTQSAQAGGILPAQQTLPLDPAPDASADRERP